jgi:hypothetical protein
VARNASDAIAATIQRASASDGFAGSRNVDVVRGGALALAADPNSTLLGVCVLKAIGQPARWIDGNLRKSTSKTVNQHAAIVFERECPDN